MVSKSILITNEKGLHLRPVTILCQSAAGFQSRVTLSFHDKTIDGKSLLSVLAAGLRCGDRVLLTCDGPDEKEAMDCLLGLFQSDFVAF